MVLRTFLFQKDTMLNGYLIIAVDLLIDKIEILTYECKIRGVSFEDVSGNKLIDIYSTIEQNNMDIILLEKKPKIAIYTPPNKQPWDDAVTLALTYAEVDYETLWDEDVHYGKIAKL